MEAPGAPSRKELWLRGRGAHYIRMLVIRFFRQGKKNQPSFKIVVTDKRKSSTGGRFVEDVGFYNPITKEKNLKAERIKYWISVGAKPLETVHNLLVSGKIIEGKKIKIYRRLKKLEEAASVGAVASQGEKSKEGQPAVVVAAPVQEKPAEVKPAETPVATEKPANVSTEASAKVEAPKAENQKKETPVIKKSEEKK